MLVLRQLRPLISSVSQNLSAVRLTPDSHPRRSIHRYISPTLKILNSRRQKIGPEPAAPRSSHLEWNYEAEIYAFGHRVGEQFGRALIKRALRTSSYNPPLNESAAAPEVSPNQKEFVEDGHDIIRNYLSREFAAKYPDESISNAVVAHLMSEEMLSHVALHMGLKDLVLTEEFPVSSENLSNSFKAVVSALKQSQDLARSEMFVKDFLVSQLNGKDVLFDIWVPEKPLDYLSTLLRDVEVEPRLCNQSAANTILANYQVGLYDKASKKLLGSGWGENVSIAKDTAALHAIQNIYSSREKLA